MKRLALIGCPLGHSLSPVMHNAALKELGLENEIKYELRPTSESELHSVVSSVQQQDLVGVNVTIPYKSKIMNHLSELSEDALGIGSVNTLVQVDDNVRGHNTDAAGFLNSLKEHSINLRGKKAIVLGAGGAARAVAYSLVQEGISRLDLVNRSQSNADKLVSEMNLRSGCEVKIWSLNTSNLQSMESDLLINCTPIGMKGHSVSEMPLRPDLFHSDLVVIDLVYNPRMTKLLQEAKRQGCLVIDGTGMLVHQGALSLEMWIGEKPPVETMRSAVIEALGGS